MTTELFLYTSKECELCVEMQKELRDLVRNDPVVVHLIDIEGDAELMHRYGARIPVLVSGNREICELKLDVSKLNAFLANRDQ